MRLYLALGHVMKSCESTPLYVMGGRRVLLSYASIQDMPPAYHDGARFWMDAGKREDEVRLYLAGTCGVSGSNPEELLFKAGARERLFTYVDLFGPGLVRRKEADKAIDWWADMRLYLAGNCAGTGAAQQDYDSGARNRLLSYAFEDNWASKEFDFWVKGGPRGVSVFLDCGAYSAHVSGAEISFDKYCDYCAENGDKIDTYVQFDVVGDAVKTEANLREMERRGLRPLPVYTAAAPLRDLEALCERYKHIALGGLRGREAGTNDWRKKKLDETFEVLGKHWPVKTHAFGITAQWVLERYPVYSADSSTVIIGAGMGRVHRFRSGQFNHQHWTEEVAETWDGTIADHVGVTSGAEDATSAHVGRRLTNIRAWLEYEAYLTNLWRKKGVVWED